MQLIHRQGLAMMINDLKRLRAQSQATRAAAENRAVDQGIAASLVAWQFEKENLALAAEPDERSGPPGPQVSVGEDPIV
jgi:hypothetical protein